jgi:hypothetical protein
VLGGEGGDVGVGLGLGLADEGHAAALIEPGGDATVEGAVASGGEDGDLAAAVCLSFEFLHGGLTRGELLLDFATLVTGDAGQLFGGVAEFVGVELELGLGYVEVVGGRGGAGGCLEGGGEGFDFGLVFLDEGLELRDSLLQGEGVAGEDSGLERSLAEGEGEGLVDFVVGEALGFASEGLFFGRDGERREGLDGLPGALVDEIARGVALGFEKGHVGHGAAGDEGC